MDLKTLADLIAEHTHYCDVKYDPQVLTHLPAEQALKFKEQMTQSLTHFGMWIDTVKSKEPK